MSSYFINCCTELAQGPVLFMFQMPNEHRSTWTYFYKYDSQQQFTLLKKDVPFPTNSSFCSINVYVYQEGSGKICQVCIHFECTWRERSKSKRSTLFSECLISSWFHRYNNLNLSCNTFAPSKH